MQFWDKKSPFHKYHTVVHGDFKSGNFMINSDRDDNNKDSSNGSDMVLFDFQTSVVNMPFYDILMVLYNNATASFRKKNEVTHLLICPF